MLAYVVRTTVKIPEELDERLRHEAKRRGSTISDVTRSALEAQCDEILRPFRERTIDLPKKVNADAEASGLRDAASRGEAQGERQRKGCA